LGERAILGARAPRPRKRTRWTSPRCEPGEAGRRSSGWLLAGIQQMH
jgi:hypothetical protein